MVSLLDIFRSYLLNRLPLKREWAIRTREGKWGKEALKVGIQGFRDFGMGTLILQI
jgi:hypothetical protein